jgi:hypothetical protein
MLRSETLQITPEILSLISRIDEFKGAWRALGTRLGAPAFQRRLTDLPALGQLGLRHASSVHVENPFGGVVRSTMKALFAGKGK